jgi:hypothetical protein
VLVGIETELSPWGAGLDRGRPTRSEYPINPLQVAPARVQPEHRPHVVNILVGAEGQELRDHLRATSSPGSEVTGKQVRSGQPNTHTVLCSQRVEVGIDGGGLDLVTSEKCSEHSYGGGGQYVVPSAGCATCRMVVANQATRPGRGEQVDADGLPKVGQRIVVAAERNLVLDSRHCNLLVRACYFDGLTQPSNGPVVSAAGLRLGRAFRTLVGQLSLHRSCQPALPAYLFLKSVATGLQ